MAQQLINLGTTINDGTGDTLRLGAQKINENFSELYDVISSDGSLSVVSKITPGNGLSVSSQFGPVTINALTASTTQAGIVKVGSGLTITDGVLSANSYTLPKAASNILGGIKVGNNLTIDNDGVLSAVATPYTLPTASVTTKGGVRIGTGLEMVGDVLNVTTSEIAAALQSGDSIVSLEVENDVNILRSNLAVNLQSQGAGSSSLEWIDDVEDPTVQSFVKLNSTGLEITLGSTEEPVTLSIDNSGQLTLPGYLYTNYQIQTTAGIIWENSPGAIINNVPLNEYFIIATNTITGEQRDYKFGYDGIFSSPLGVKIFGDTSAIQATIDGLQDQYDQELIQLSDLQEQFGNAQSELVYWQGVAASSPPGSPQQSAALGQVSYWQGQISSLSGIILSIQNSLSSLQSQISQEQALLSQSNVLLTYEVEDESLTLDHGGIKFPDGTIQTTAFLGVSPPDVTVDSLDNESFSVVLDSEGVLTIPSKIASTTNLTFESITDLQATAGEDIIVTSSVGFALRNYSTTEGINVTTSLGDESEKTWTFDPSGQLKLPAGGTIVNSDGQILVQTGFRVVTSPTTSKGYTGNILGDVAFSSGNLYYCTGTYDGITDIWVKTAWQTTGTWTEEGEGGGIE